MVTYVPAPAPFATVSRTVLAVGGPTAPAPPTLPPGGAFSAVWVPATATVLLAWAGSVGTATRMIITRTVPGVTTPVTVRGSALTPAVTSLSLSDREFTPNVVNTYVLSFYNGVTLTATATATVTPTPSATWLRSPLRPFLDMIVTVTDFSAVTMPARAGVFEVLGRRLPVALTEVRGSKRFDLTLTTTDAAGAAALETFLSFGDVVLVQPPSTACAVPGPLYAQVGDVVERRPGRHDGARRYFVLPLVECSGPDPLVVGSTITWAGVVSAFATWNAVLAAKATWNDLCATVSAPTDEIIA